MNQQIHISSIVVTADPRRVGLVVDEIAQIPIANIAVRDPSGKLIVTLETESEAAMVQALTDIQLLPGVASAALVYHHVAADAAIPAEA